MEKNLEEEIFPESTQPPDPDAGAAEAATDAANNNLPAPRDPQEDLQEEIVTIRDTERAALDKSSTGYAFDESIRYAEDIVQANAEIREAKEAGESVAAVAGGEIGDDEEGGQREAMAARIAEAQEVTWQQYAKSISPEAAYKPIPKHRGVKRVMQLLHFAQRPKMNAGLEAEHNAAQFALQRKLVADMIALNRSAMDIDPSLAGESVARMKAAKAAWTEFNQARELETYTEEFKKNYESITGQAPSEETSYLARLRKVNEQQYFSARVAEEARWDADYSDAVAGKMEHYSDDEMRDRSKMHALNPDAYDVLSKAKNQASARFKAETDEKTKPVKSAPADLKEAHAQSTHKDKFEMVKSNWSEVVRFERDPNARSGASDFPA
jgi:hypothetical protein